MARSSRRPTFWSGAYLDTTIPEDASGSFVITPAAELEDEQNKEPTLVRTFGRLCVGSQPPDGISLTVTNIWLGLCLLSATDVGIPDPRVLSDDRFVWTGFVRTVWAFHYHENFTSAGVGTTVPGTVRAYQGPWEMVDFETRAMRRARTNDALTLVSRSITSTGDPTSISLNGFIRALWKAR